jgi:hypothetical protein
MLLASSCLDRWRLFLLTCSTVVLTDDGCFSFRVLRLSWQMTVVSINVLYSCLDRWRLFLISCSTVVLTDDGCFLLTPHYICILNVPFKQPTHTPRDCKHQNLSFPDNSGLLPEVWTLIRSITQSVTSKSIKSDTGNKFCFRNIHKIVLTYFVRRLITSTFILILVSHKSCLLQHL